MTATVLYIEDQDDNVVLVQRIMTRRPQLDLFIARTGGEGIHLAHQTRPTLILLDRRLPDMPGEDVLTEITTDETLAGTTVIMLSGDTTEEHVAAARAAGAAAYLSKPFDVSELLAVVDRYCS